MKKISTKAAVMVTVILGVIFGIQPIIEIVSILGINHMEVFVGLFQGIFLFPGLLIGFGAAALSGDKKKSQFDTLFIAICVAGATVVANMSMNVLLNIIIKIWPFTIPNTIAGLAVVVILVAAYFEEKRLK